MAAASERIPVLVTPEQKQRYVTRAKAAGMTTGEFLRRAADVYQPAAEEALLEGLLLQVEKSTAQANRALDEALLFVAESEARLRQAEKEAC